MKDTDFRETEQMLEAKHKKLVSDISYEVPDEPVKTVKDRPVWRGIRVALSAALVLSVIFGVWYAAEYAKHYSPPSPAAGSSNAASGQNNAYETHKQYDTGTDPADTNAVTGEEKTTTQLTHETGGPGDETDMWSGFDDLCRAKPGLALRGETVVRLMNSISEENQTAFMNELFALSDFDASVDALIEKYKVYADADSEFFEKCIRSVTVTKLENKVPVMNMNVAVGSQAAEELLSLIYGLRIGEPSGLTGRSDKTVYEIDFAGLLTLCIDGDGRVYSPDDGKRYDTLYGSSAQLLTVLDALTSETETTDNSAEELPDGFSFSFVWNTYGISSYDSRTGTLIKTNDATDVSKYTATVFLTNEQLQTVYDLLFKEIDITGYPDEYDPFNDPDAEIKMISTPSQTVIISVTADGRTKTVACRSISFGGIDACYCAEARDFMTAVNKLKQMLTSLPEWQALPEYEFFYD